MGRIIGVGLGPGAADLMTVRAREWLMRARHVAYFRKRGHPGQARRIVQGLLAPTAVEHAMEYPVTTELRFDSVAYNDVLARFYDEWAARLLALTAHDDVVVLCEGDPLFYGSFMHLHVRLSHRVAVEVVPGLPGMVGCWAALGMPMTWGDDVLTVVLGTLPPDRLVAHMQAADALVVMKVGRHLAQVRRALDRVGRLDQAWLVEFGTMPQQRVRRLADVGPDERCPYFSLVLVHGHGRRPQERGA
ncbi:precorrin-2 C(20)-methyltransferase [Tepidimonas taiwanensis]|uniref:precorrin-2 C(20)-methyltransferase n=1 Tax=Tepidimonas taiwanensis TaxID=307486 RepID=UPI000733E04C|nr:precorrin-2 C(20)-methyltransferase [Tepidimonas taiwanensis]